MEIISLQNAKEKDITRVGKRVVILSKISESFSVPLGFVLTKDAYTQFIEETGLKKNISNMLKAISSENSKNIQNIANEIQKLIISQQLSEDITEQISDAYESLNIESDSSLSSLMKSNEEPVVNINPSPIGEMSTGAHLCFPNIKGKEKLIDTIIACFASNYTANAIKNRLGKNKDDEGIAVVVQQMRYPAVSGMVSQGSCGETSKIIITSCYGFMNDEVIDCSDEYVVDAKTLKIIDKAKKRQNIEYRKALEKNELIKQSISENKAERQKLPDEEITALARAARRIFSYADEHIMFEYGIEKGKLFVLQADEINISETQEAQTTEDIRKDHSSRSEMQNEDGKTSREGDSLETHDKIFSAESQESLLKTGNSSEKDEEYESIIIDIDDEEEEPKGKKSYSGKEEGLGKTDNSIAGVGGLQKKEESDETDKYTDDSDVIEEEKEEGNKSSDNESKYSIFSLFRKKKQGSNEPEDDSGIEKSNASGIDNGEEQEESKIKETPMPHNTHNMNNDHARADEESGLVKTGGMQKMDSGNQDSNSLAAKNAILGMAKAAKEQIESAKKQTEQDSFNNTQNSAKIMQEPQEAQKKPDENTALAAGMQKESIIKKDSLQAPKPGISKSEQYFAASKQFFSQSIISCDMAISSRIRESYKKACGSPEGLYFDEMISGLKKHKQVPYEEEIKKVKALKNRLTENGIEPSFDDIKFVFETADKFLKDFSA